MTTFLLAFLLVAALAAIALCCVVSFGARFDEPEPRFPPELMLRPGDTIGWRYGSNPNRYALRRVEPVDDADEGWLE